MNSGLFCRHVTLTIPSGSATAGTMGQASASIDQYGQAEYTYYTASCFARVDNLSGNQEDTQGILHDTATYNFTMRYRADVTEDTTITYKGQDYRITFIEYLKPRDYYMRLVGQRRN